MEVMSIGSGSSGNCFYLYMGGKHLLVDLGLNAKAITAALSGIGISPADIDGVFITHIHSDHTSALKVMRKRLNCPYFLSTLSNSKLCLPDAVLLAPGRPTEILGGIRVTAFETAHDCPGSMGFRLDWGGESFGYATDLGQMTEEIREILKGSRCMVLESNHDVQMLKDGPYPFELKRRILSGHGHLSNDCCGENARYFVQNGTKTLFLAHLSRENNTPELALSTVSAALAGTGADVEVLPQYGGCLRCPE